ncbi:hypothetical protein Trydic_g11627 [Trypoxylus dichotomus]
MRLHKNVIAVVMTNTKGLLKLDITRVWFSVSTGLPCFLLLHYRSRVSAKASTLSSVVKAIPRTPWIGGTGARCFFMTFTAPRMRMLQQHSIMIRQELVENGQLVELGDLPDSYDIQDVGLSIVQEYRGLDDSVYQKVEAVDKTA